MAGVFRDAHFMDNQELCQFGSIHNLDALGAAKCISAGLTREATGGHEDAALSVRSIKSTGKLLQIPQLYALARGDACIHLIQSQCILDSGAIDQ